MSLDMRSATFSLMDICPTKDLPKVMDSHNAFKQMASFFFLSMESGLEVLCTTDINRYTRDLTWEYLSF